MFDARSATEKDRITDDVVTLFKRLVTSSEAPRMDVVLKFGVRSLAELPDATFLDIYRMFMDEEFRKAVVSRLSDPELIKFWNQTYPGYPHPATEQPILSRTGQFAISKTLSTITGTTSSLHISDVMQESKILLCSIPKGTIGTDTSAILGTLLVSQFQLASQRRTALRAAERIPFYLYIDEFQSFATSNFVGIITEARKYQLCLTLANQTLGDLPAEMKGAVEGVETSLYFAPFPSDAAHVSRSLGGRFTTDALLDLDKWEAILKPGRASHAIKVRLSEPPQPGDATMQQTIRENTLRNYPSVRPARVAQELPAVGDIPRTGDPLPE